MLEDLQRQPQSLDAEFARVHNAFHLTVQARFYERLQSGQDPMQAFIVNPVLRSLFAQYKSGRNVLAEIDSLAREVYMTSMDSDGPLWPVSFNGQHQQPRPIVEPTSHYSLQSNQPYVSQSKIAHRPHDVSVASNDELNGILKPTIDSKHVTPTESSEVIVTGRPTTNAEALALLDRLRGKSG
ncbi:hypothetical protein EK21DRAFT_118657 [Setomelanomma holmii]|uniref:Uncharacterized protein n=1 Tax=Setomelanomma holmii TaxID=210430 RepID=A0A9P4LGG3_9PLEO|nr:hypothetical protein EK21DRAFT_118657 [Setomelanomma holmii]